MTRKYPPITAAEMAQLKADAADIKAAAARKQVTLDSWDEHQEKAAAKEHFTLGCWLYYYNNLFNRSSGGDLKDRIDCARRIFEAGLNNPRYQFFTVFDFGERQFDSIFEQGDSFHVVHSLRALLPKDQTGYLKEAFHYMGWPLVGVAKIAVTLTSTDGVDMNFDVIPKDGKFVHVSRGRQRQPSGPTESAAFTVIDTEGRHIAYASYPGDVWRDMEGTADTDEIWTRIFRGNDIDTVIGNMEKDLYEEGLISNPIYPDGYDPDPAEDDTESEAPQGA